MNPTPPADICLILEGTYPFVTGGVSVWVHDLIKEQAPLTFHLLCILPPKAKTEPLYVLPDNVVGISKVFLQEDLPGTTAKVAQESLDAFFPELKKFLGTLHFGDMNTLDFTDFLKAIKKLQAKAPGALNVRNLILDSADFWELIKELYQQHLNHVSFMNYFWSMRILLSTLFSVMLAPYPEARTYHALCTGYAGLLLVRIRAETKALCLLTEHGIYTVERQIEIVSSPWITAGQGLHLDPEEKNLIHFWINTFNNYARLCYQACDKVIALYPEDQKFQLSQGVDPAKSQIIANGINIEKYSHIKRTPYHHRDLVKNPFTIAFIGRIVPIKDIKTYIQGCAILRDLLGTQGITGWRAFIIGTGEWVPDYHEDCVTYVQQEDLESFITFTGFATLENYLSQIDVVVLTSISEGQPLTILEAGAVGIPVVATSVGSCPQLVLGQLNEDPYCGDGGIIIPLKHPQAMAEAILKLFNDPTYYQNCAQGLKKRITHFHKHSDQHNAYADIYNTTKNG
ncbi:MAG: GT4 family glycosyltransferase PelF [Alphaproteobacteria bacterium]